MLRDGSTPMHKHTQSALIGLNGYFYFLRQKDGKGMDALRGPAQGGGRHLVHMNKKHCIQV